MEQILTQIRNVSKNNQDYKKNNAKVWLNNKTNMQTTDYVFL